MSDDFNVYQWMYQTGESARRSGTALAANAFDSYLLRSRAKGRRHRRLWPWVLGALVWFGLPWWLELVITVVSVGTAAITWLVVNESRASGRL